MTKQARPSVLSAAFQTPPTVDQPPLPRARLLSDQYAAPEPINFDALADQVTERIRAVESALASSPFRIETGICLADEKSTLVEFTRIGKVWRLVAWLPSAQYEESFEARRLADEAPLDIRIGAAQVLDALVDKMISRHQEQTKAIHQALASTEAALNKLKGGK